MATPTRSRFAALALALAVATGACDGEPDDDTLTEGLLVLSGQVGAVTLMLDDGESQPARELALPDPATAWVSAGRTNVLLATLIDGRTFVSGPLDDAVPEWRLVEAVTVTDEPPQPPLYFGTWDPPGGAYVQLGATFGTAGFRVVTVDPALEGASEVALDERRPVATPPAWIDDDRVVVVTVNGSTTATVIVDTTTGETAPGPPGARLLTTSADATTVATWSGPGNPVEIVATEAWLAGQAGAIRIDPPGGSAGPAVLALDGAGERLAVVWADDRGAPTSVTVHAETRNWGQADSFGLGEAQAAALAWLR
jgi:hypothetical protein